MMGSVTTTPATSNVKPTSTMSALNDSRRDKIKLFKLLLILISIQILLVSLKPIGCQSTILSSTSTNSNTNGDDSNNNNDTSSDTSGLSRTTEEINSQPSAENATTGISSPPSITTVAPASELLLSVSEFVDFTERPTFLFDGVSNESNDSKSESATGVNKTTEDSTISEMQERRTVEPTDSRVPIRPEFASAAAEANATTTTMTTTTTNSSTVGGELDENSDGDGDSDDGSEEDEPSDSDFHDSARIFTPPQNVSQYMDYIEALVHDFRHRITDLFEPHIPKWIRTSQMVQLSSACSYDMLRLALALRKFEPWALRMIDSSGKVPEGIFEGSFTSLGSYDGCLSIAFEPSMTSSHQPSTSGASNHHQALQQTQGKYCLVNVSPFLPPKPPTDKVDRVFQDEANRRNYAKDDQFSRLSPMFYYMKFRIGVCIPSTCLDSDMEAVASALSSTLRLNITIPNCRVRQSRHQFTGAELAGGIVFGLVLSTVLVATLFDCSRRKLAQMGNHHYKAALQGCQIVSMATDAPSVDNRKAGTWREAASLSQNIHWPSASSNQSQESNVSARRRLDRHWSWRSFSLLTNYKLYFEHKSSTLAVKQAERWQQEGPMNKESSLWSSQIGAEHRRLSALSPATDRLMLVRCLDGIRVLSLCWVIVANSYITLDPRATKRLTKTREAPKDFLFQVIVQASLAIETFFFLSGVLMSLSFARRLKPDRSSTSAASMASSERPLATRGRQPKVGAAINGKVIGSSIGRDDVEQLGAMGVSSPSLRETAATAVTDDGIFCRKVAASVAVRWLQFYVHRYIRVTPATMLVIAFAMFAYSYGDGPLWFEATHKAHLSCGENWWRHLLHVANFIDTRQMCFIHYWYIAADMQLFLFAPILLFLIYKQRKLGYALAALVGLLSICSVFYTTYIRNLPPTLLFYSSDPESRREFGNTIMTKPLTHALPYMVGMLLGKWLASNRQLPDEHDDYDDLQHDHHDHDHRHHPNHQATPSAVGADRRSHLATLVGLLACLVALGEVFLPYRWNNSQLPTRLLAALYAALFRFAWSLVLACLVVSCRHKRGHKCLRAHHQLIRRAKLPTTTTATRGRWPPTSSCCYCCCCSCLSNNCHSRQQQLSASSRRNDANGEGSYERTAQQSPAGKFKLGAELQWCFCGAAGSLLNRFLSLDIFTHLSKLSFVAYLIHLPLMSVFIAQTRGLFAFSHTLVIHLALSYLVMTFALSFVLVHIIEFPFITFEVHLFERLLGYLAARRGSGRSGGAKNCAGSFPKHREQQQ